MSKTTASAVAPGGPAAAEEREVVRVNNANLTELKNACDDALKKYLARPDLFKQIYTHTDVRLALGWLSVFVAAGTGLYGWKIDFEKAKPVVWAGLLLYILLTGSQTLYAYFVERDTVFVGKRKTFDKRIVTERLTVSSKTGPASKPKKQAKAPAPTSTPASAPSSVPTYKLALSLLRTASGGKTLLARATHEEARAYSAFFDAEGVLDVDAFESWVASLVGKVIQ